MAAGKNVLFVCTGNTCRSPLAEGLFRKLTTGRDDYAVASAGVAAADGGKASAETIEVLKKRGVQLDGFRSRMVTRELMDWATHVFAMTAGHVATLERMFPEATDKIYLACDFADVPGHGVGCDVPDPIGMGRGAYERVARVLEVALPAVVSFLDQTDGGGSRAGESL